MNGLLKVGKAIVVTGAKGVAFSAGMVIIATAVTEGLQGVKDLDIDKVLK